MSGNAIYFFIFQKPLYNLLIKKKTWLYCLMGIGYLVLKSYKEEKKWN